MALVARLVNNDVDEVEVCDGAPDGCGTTGGGTNLTLARVGEFLWIAFTIYFRSTIEDGEKEEKEEEKTLVSV